jgi:hypothetical protein
MKIDQPPVYKKYRKIVFGRLGKKKSKTGS